MTYNQLLKKMQSNSLDKQTCIDYFKNLSKTRSYISFSSKMIINLFKYKHDYIFKYLFDNGIIYSSYFDDNIINKLSRSARKSESLVYAINFPSILIYDKDSFMEKESFFYAKYTQEQKNTLKYISHLYHNLKFCDGKINHPYDIYFSFYYPRDNKKLQFDFFKNKLIEYKDKIEHIKLYFFEFYDNFEKITDPLLEFILNFFHKNNCFSNSKLITRFLTNKYYLNYFLNNTFLIKEFPTDFNQYAKLFNTEDTIKISKHIIDCLDTNFKYSISNSLSLIYFYIIESLIQKDDLFNFYVNILLDLVIKHDTDFEYLCKEFNYCTEYNTLNLDILLELSKNQEFKQLFDKQKKSIKTENKLISDYIHIQLNQECF